MSELVYREPHGYRRTRLTCSSSTVAANGRASEALTIIVERTMANTDSYILVKDGRWVSRWAKVVALSRMVVGELKRPTADV